MPALAKPLILLLLITMPFVAYPQDCYQLDRGEGLSLFSPFLDNNPRFRKLSKVYAFGDTSKTFFCNKTSRIVSIGAYEAFDDEPVFAAHSGIANIYTSINTLEANPSSDAVWIDGGTITTNYIGLVPVVRTGQYIYAGQLLGRMFKDKFENVFGFGIRRAPPINPIHKRGFLPYKADDNTPCECNREPLWPEHFINPTSKFIAYDKFNEYLPEASLKVNISPSGIGQWSFDNGATWLNGGNKISGLPFGYYKIIFKNEYGHSAPDVYNTKIYSTNKELVLDVAYTPDYTILQKPEAQLQREADQKLIDQKLVNALDSLNEIVNADDKTEIFRNSIIDSLNNRFIKIEEIQKETFFFTKLFKYILPILILAIIFVLILLIQNAKIRRQKRYLENLQREQHHRVHNNLAVVSGLLNKYKDNIDKEKLADINNSVIAISTVHRQLYKGRDLEYINFQPVAKNISQSLLLQRELSNEDVETDINANITIPQSKSTILALMFNELFTNSLKYAFEDAAYQKISLIAGKEESHFFVLYRDNGKGYTSDFLKQKTTGFGRLLLNGLANQLKAKIDFYNEEGACCFIKFGLHEKPK